MTSEEVRQKFIDFWKSTPRDHKDIPSVSLVPEENSTLLFVNSGMFPLAPYLAGQAHPMGKRLCDIQRCLRTKYDEMIEVGDNRHTLMFEMMGNWSLGDYFKKEQIPWVLEMYVKVFNVDPTRLYVSVWGGDTEVPRDETAVALWKQAFKKIAGIDAEFSENIEDIPLSPEAGKTHKARIFPYGRKKNWWQRGEAPGELGGTTSEIFYDLGKVARKVKQYHINDDSGRFFELGNSVFMEYKLDDKLKWQKLPQKNVDFGGGFERLVMIVQNKNDIYETDLYQSILDKVEQLSGKKYKTASAENESTAAFRVIADHGRAATFILGDGVTPSNKDQGYILRRFIRRLVRFGKKLGIEENFTGTIGRAVIDRMKKVYPHLEMHRDKIIEELDKEETKFRQTLDKGLKELEKLKRGKLDGKKAFYLYESFGFPLEMTLDELGANEKTATALEKEFKEIEQSHREKSRTGAEKKFKGGLAGHADVHIRYHTAIHLLLSALKKILGSEVHQQGSNITDERLRFDFNYGKPLTKEELEKVEGLVNEYISEDLEIKMETMSKEEAKKKGAECTFWERYPEQVKVYTIFDPKTKKVISMELCGGPHVKSLAELKSAGHFTITKEESSSAGVRRIKAVLENS